MSEFDQNCPVHYLPALFISALRKSEDIEVVNYHQTASGWLVILRCKLTQKEYIGSLKPAELEIRVEKPLTFNEFMGEN